MLRSSVNSVRGTEDEALHADRAHGFEQFDCARDIVVKILKRFPDGFANRFKAGKVNDSFICSLRSTCLSSAPSRMSPSMNVGV